MVIEKRLKELRIRLTDSEWLAMSQLADMDDRSMGDLGHHVIALYLYGHEYKIQACENKSHQAMRDCEG